VLSDEIRRTAEALVGAPIRAVTAATSGGNSRIFLVETAAERCALKAYPLRAGDARDRADIEWRALDFLRRHGVTTVPRPLARDAGGHFLLMEWVDGAPLDAHSARDLAHAADFVARIFALSAEPAAARFPLASEACLSAAEIVRQVETRLPALTSEPRLRDFLEQRFAPLLDERRAAAARDADYASALALSRRRLIPADFGFHNALRQEDGSLRFIDFEYFGWDDPVKLTADFLLHPAMRLSAEDRGYFAGRMAAALPEDHGFAERLRCRLPLFALRWMLILLNPFRADRAVELAAAARDALLQDRLAKAEALVPWVTGAAVLP
jgi:fructosamine-3-kinase